MLIPENEHPHFRQQYLNLPEGKTIVTIAHRLATIEQADQILVVDDGQDYPEQEPNNQLVQVGKI